MKNAKNDNSKRPAVGVGLLVFKNGKILLGKRKGGSGDETYGSVGGHLEYRETIKRCAEREAFEEAGIRIKNIRFLCVSNLRIYKEHCIDVGLAAEWKSGIPKVKEKHRCESFNWYSIDQLPKPLFEPIKNYIKAYKTKKSYFDN